MKQIEDNNIYDMFPVDDISDFEPNVDVEFDVERIQTLTFAKLHTEQKECRKMKKTSVKILIAAALVAVISSTALAAANSGFFDKVLGNTEILKTEDIENVAITAENKDIQMTVEQVLSDGCNHKMIVSAMPKTKQAADVLFSVPLFAELKQDEERVFGYSTDALGNIANDEKQYYVVNYESREEVSGMDLYWTFSWKAAPEYDSKLQPLDVLVSHQRTMQQQKTVMMEEGLPVKEIRISAISASAVTDIYKEETPTPIVLVMKDGTEELLFLLEEKDGIGGGGVSFVDETDDISQLPLVSGETYRIDEEKNEMMLFASFSRVLDFENIEGVQIGDVLYPISE